MYEGIRGAYQSMCDSYKNTHNNLEENFRRVILNLAGVNPDMELMTRSNIPPENTDRDWDEFVKYLKENFEIRSPTPEELRCAALEKRALSGRY